MKTFLPHIDIDSFSGLELCSSIILLSNFSGTLLKITDYLKNENPEVKNKNAR